MNKPFYLMKFAGITLLPLLWVLGYSGFLSQYFSVSEIEQGFKYLLFLSLGLFTFGVYNEQLKSSFNTYINIIGGITLFLFVIIYGLGFGA